MPKNSKKFDLAYHWVTKKRQALLESACLFLLIAAREPNTARKRYAFFRARVRKIAARLAERDNSQQTRYHNAPL